MNAMVLLVAASAVGLDVGWMPLQTGGVEYIIQIEPDLVDTVLKKKDLESAIPTGLDVRLVRMHVGTDKLPQDPPLSTLGARSGVGQAPKAADPAAGGAPPASAPIAAPAGSAAGGGAAAPGSGSGATGVLPLGPPPGYVPPAKAGAANPASGAPSNGSGAAAPINSVPIGSAPIGSAPATGGVALGGAAVGGPALDFPATNPATKKTRDAVSGAFDDPSAPGRSTSADTGQPHLSREEMLASSGAGTSFSAHEANRPQDFDRNANQSNPPLSNGFANGNNNNGSRNFNNNPNERNVSERSENLVPTGPANEPKPWSTLIFTVTLLLASVSLNFYLGWVAWDSRFRYRELLAQTGDLPLPV